jgi:hypothetical protein
MITIILRLKTTHGRTVPLIPIDNNRFHNHMVIVILSSPCGQASPPERITDLSDNSPVVGCARPESECAEGLCHSKISYNVRSLVDSRTAAATRWSMPKMGARGTESFIVSRVKIVKIQSRVNGVVLAAAPVFMLGACSMATSIQRER